MPEVARTAQQVPPAKLIGGMVAAWQRATSTRPSRNLLRSLIALCWIETSHGKLVNNSPGNVMAGGFAGGVERITWQGDYWRPPWFENKANKLHQPMLDGQVPSAFRAFSSLEAGLENWAKTLRSNFPEVVAAGEIGDPERFVGALQKRYSEDYNTEHVQTFRALFSELDKSSDFNAVMGRPMTASAGSSSGWVAVGVITVGVVTAAIAVWFALRTGR
jgi:hypothetical protein